MVPPLGPERPKKLHHFDEMCFQCRFSSAVILKHIQTPLSFSLFEFNPFVSGVLAVAVFKPKTLQLRNVALRFLPSLINNTIILFQLAEIIFVSSPLYRAAIYSTLWNRSVVPPSWRTQRCAANSVCRALHRVWREGLMFCATAVI